MTPPPPPPTVIVGERYACTSQHAGRQIEVVIGRRDVLAGQQVVSVSIFIRGDTRIPEIGHAPFEEAVLQASCPTKIADRSELSPDFEGGYREWTDDHGGFFTISVDRAIDAMNSMLPKPTGDKT